MICEKHGYTNGVYCPACDLEQVAANAPNPPAATNAGPTLTQRLEHLRDYQCAVGSPLHASITEAITRVSELEAKVAELEPAAECWNALASCYRITCMGSAGLIEPMDTGYAHATFNLWTCAKDPTKGVRDEQDIHGRDRLAQFVKIAIANLLEPRPTAPEITAKPCSTCKERPGLVRVDGNPMLGSWDICPDCNTCHECRGTGKRATPLEQRT